MIFVPKPYGTKPLPEPMLTKHQQSLVAFIWGQFPRKYSRYLAWNEFENNWFNIKAEYTRGQYVQDDVNKWKHLPFYWPFVRGIHRSPADSPHKGQWRGALMFSLICAWTKGWTNNRDAGDVTRHRAHYDVTVMWTRILLCRHWWGSSNLNLINMPSYSCRLRMWSG